MKSWFSLPPSNRSASKDMGAVRDQGERKNTSLVALELQNQLQGQVNWSSRDYAGLSKSGYQNNAICNRCVRLISEAAASVPFIIKQNDGNADLDALQSLLSRPNAKQSRAEFFEQFYGFLQLSGNAYLEAVLLDDQPRALFALRPDRVRARTDRNGWPQAWEYNAGNRKKHFPIDPIDGSSALHHMRLFHPTDDIYGFSPLNAAAQALDIHNAGGLWAKSLLDNSARPSGALVYNGKEAGDRLSQEQFDRLKHELENNHSGAQAAGRPLLLEGGLDWKAMSLSPTDMDFINARREAAREIALAFGVPPMLLGIPGDNTYANYKEANLAFWRQTILPLVGKTADSIGGWLSHWYGDGLDTGLVLCPDFEAVPILSAQRMAHWEKLDQISFLTPAEKRELAGLSKSAAR